MPACANEGNFFFQFTKTGGEKTYREKSGGEKTVGKKTDGVKTGHKKKTQ